MYFQNTEVLARRLLNGELEPAKILNMSPNELKVKFFYHCFHHILGIVDYAVVILIKLDQS